MTFLPFVFYASVIMLLILTFMYTLMDPRKNNNKKHGLLLTALSH